MSPIFVRPVREQLEHDRLIRFLQAKYTKKFESAMNLGDEQAVAIKIGVATFYPDLVLSDGKKLTGVVEVETGESVNNLEAMAQWVHFSRARVPFHLYVPVSGYDAAKRLVDAHKATITEIWAYRPVADGFDLVRQHHDPSAGGPNGKGPAAKLAPIAPKPLPPPVPEPVVVAKPEEPKPAPKPAAVAAKAVAPAKAAVPVKPVVAVKPVMPVKAAVPAKPAAPVKPAVAVKVAAPAKVVAKPVVVKSAPAKVAAKPAAPAKGKPEKKAAAKPAPKAAAKSSSKSAAKKLPAKKAAKAAPKKAAKPVRKASPPSKRAKARK